MKPPKSLRRLLCRCDNDRVWTDGTCTRCGRQTDVRAIPEQKLFRVIRRLEKRAALP